MKSKVFLSCYGGGHAQIIAALIPALHDHGFETDVIGLTTAHAFLQRCKIASQSVETLLVPEEDSHWLRLAEEFLSETLHPDITIDQTRAYFAVGLRDLALELGEEIALEKVRHHGRMAFCPVETFQRYFRKSQPGIVVSTTSPRFELAAQKAARAENIPSMAIGDLFIEAEREWILRPDYGKHLAVLSERVAESIIADGFAADCVRVTGNPAFDRLAPSKNDKARRKELRSSFGIGDKQLILCPTSSTDRAKNGQLFLEPTAWANRMEALCRSRDDITYMMRAHPNAPFEMPANCVLGLNCDNAAITAEDAILMADLILVESSTVGLQAALTGKPVICIAFADIAVYPHYGMAHIVDTLDDALAKIDHITSLPLETMGIPPLGSATSNAVQFINDILAGTPCMQIPESDLKPPPRRG